MYPRPLPNSKVRATFYVEVDLLDESRDAVYHLGGHPAHLTLTDLVNDALRAELARLRKTHLQGAPFPRRSAELKGGRPLAA